MVNTIEISSGLKDLIDAFVLAKPEEERGGIIIGTIFRFSTFLPIPNISAKQTVEYSIEGNWPMYAALFASVTGGEVMAHFHTHPRHTVFSETDIKVSSAWFSKAPYYVMLAPDKDHRRTTWWIIDRDHECQNLTAVDRELEQSSLLLARRYGFANLGRVMLTQDGELHAEGTAATLLVRSPEARRLYLDIRASDSRLITKADVAAATQITKSHVPEVLDQLLRSGLVRDDGVQGYVPRDVFGTRLAGKG